MNSIIYVNFILVHTIAYVDQGNSNQNIKKYIWYNILFSQFFAQIFESIN